MSGNSSRLPRRAIPTREDCRKSLLDHISVSGWVFMAVKRNGLKERKDLNQKNLTKKQDKGSMSLRYDGGKYLYHFSERIQEVMTSSFVKRHGAVEQKEESYEG